MNTVKNNLYTNEELILIGTEAMVTMKKLSADVYFAEMVYQDEWFNIAIRAVPEKEGDLIEWIQTCESLPREDIDEIIYQAERVVFGVTIHEYNAFRENSETELLYSGFCAIRLAQARADHYMGRF